MKALYWENRLSRVIALKIAQRFHRYAALGPFSTLRYTEVPEPVLPGPRWLKARTIACGLCGTDLHFMFMDLDPKCFPAALPGAPRKYLGHELVAEVMETGGQVDTVAVGDRVALRIDWLSCHQLEIEPPCPQCATGNYMLCENVGEREPLVTDTGGGFSSHILMHRSQPFLIPKSLSTDAALLIEPLASAVHGVLKAPPEACAPALVIGGGTIGLLTVAALRGLFPGSPVHCLVRYPYQEEAARKLGATPIREGRDRYARVARAVGARHIQGYFGNEILLGGFPRVYDAVGSDASVSDALRYARGGGSVVLMGINFTPRKIDYTPVWCQEVNLLGINCHATESDGRSSFAIATELLLRGVVDPALIITHRFPVHEYKAAVKTFLNKGEHHAIKIVLDADTEYT